MKGYEFEKVMKDNGYNQSSLAKRWGMVRQTIANICKSENVEPLYADAILSIAYEKQAKSILGIVNLYNQ